MSRLCIGTAQFGMRYGIANATGKVGFDSIIQIIDYSVSNGIEFFDTAQSYGDSEILLGNAIDVLKLNHKAKIISKLSPEISPENVNSIFNNSLKNLKIDSLWGVLLHRYNLTHDYSEIYKEISILKSEGKLNYFGVSTYEPEDAMHALTNDDIDIIQVPFNILDRRLIDLDFFNLAKKNNKKIFIRSIYLQGLLLMNNEQLIKKNMQWAIPHLSYLWNFIEQNKLDIKEFALMSILDVSNNSKIITGIDSLTQLKENNIASNSNNINRKILDSWWKNLPIYPVKLLNPSLW